MMASFLNTLITQGYSNDMVDRYEVNRKLCLSREEPYRGTVVTSFQDFLELYSNCEKADRKFSRNQIASLKPVH